jgi:transcriptional regulator with XRE-family HTH domain
MILQLRECMQLQLGDVGEKAVKALGTREYDLLIEVVRQARLDAGVGIPNLSKRLGQSPAYIYKVETRGRRLDVVEFRSIALALGLSPSELFERWLSRVEADVGSSNEP